MPAKKSIMKKSQKQKQQQKQVVNVVINQPVKKAKRKYKRRIPKMEEEQLQISAKQLSPVFIQPPVTSQYMPMQQSQQPLQTIFQPEQPKKQIKSAIDIFEEFPIATAEPLYIPKEDYLKETDFIMPVDNLDKKNNLVDESFGIYYEQVLKDTDIHDMNEEFKRASLANVDKTPTPFELSKERDVMAFYDKKPDLEKKPEKREYKIKKPSRRQINNFKLYAIDQSLTEMSDSEISNFIMDTMRTEGLTIQEFNSKYMDMRRKEKEMKSLRNIYK